MFAVNYIYVPCVDMLEDEINNDIKKECLDILEQPEPAQIIYDPILKKS